MPLSHALSGLQTTDIISGRLVSGCGRASPLISNPTNCPSPASRNSAELRYTHWTPRGPPGTLSPVRPEAHITERGAPPPPPSAPRAPPEVPRAGPQATSGCGVRAAVRALSAGLGSRRLRVQRSAPMSDSRGPPAAGRLVSGAFPPRAGAGSGAWPQGRAESAERAGRVSADSGSVLSAAHPARCLGAWASVSPSPCSSHGRLREAATPVHGPQRLSPTSPSRARACGLLPGALCGYTPGSILLVSFPIASSPFPGSQRLQALEPLV